MIQETIPTIHTVRADIIQDQQLYLTGWFVGSISYQSGLKTRVNNMHIIVKLYDIQHSTENLEMKDITDQHKLSPYLQPPYANIKTQKIYIIPTFYSNIFYYTL